MMKEINVYLLFIHLKENIYIFLDSDIIWHHLLLEKKKRLHFITIFMCVCVSRNNNNVDVLKFRFIFILTINYSQI
jgi:hypothetical protein